MNMEFKRKMPTPQAVKEMYPITPELAERKKATDTALRKIFTGEDDRTKYSSFRAFTQISPARPATATRACSISPTQTARRICSAA